MADSQSSPTVMSVSAATTVSILAPGYDMKNVGASVVEVKDKVTTYSLGCLDGSNPNDNTLCGFLYGPTITQGPSTWAVHTEATATRAKKTYTQSLGCELDYEKDQASCTMEGNYPNRPMSTHDVIKGLKSLEYPVPVTAGANKLDSKATGGSGTPTDSSGGAAQTSDDAEDVAASTKISLFGLFTIVCVVSALL